MDFRIFAVNGMGLSGFYVMVALGLTVAFGVMRILNFAHGELYMVGAYVVWLFYSSGVLPFFAAVLLSMLVVCALGLLIERGLFWPLRASPTGALLASVGAMFIMQVIVGATWGVGMNKPIPAAYPAINIWGISTDAHRLIVIITSLALMGVLWFFFNRTKTGVAMRACVEGAEAASLCGISVRRMSAIAMGISGALAGLAGALMSPLVMVNPYMGTYVVFKAFIIIIVGGMGSIKGTIVSAFLFGFMDSIILSLADSTTANLVGLLFMLTILAVRPRGLFGHET